MAEIKQISPAQRAQNFASATRQNFHMLPSQTVTQLGTTVQFTYPKSRLLSKTFVKFEVECSQAVNNLTDFTPYELVRRISLSLNNGFEPFVISGRDLAILNMLRMNSFTIPSSKEGLVTGKGTNRIVFVLEMENTLNQRDASSLILLQNESTQVTLSIDIATSAPEQFGTVNKIVVTPCLQTYTIPNYAEAFPDLSCIKLVKSRTETLSSSGEHVLKLDVGTIYRKLVFYVTDENGNGVDLINSNIELIYNTADTPISIDPVMLKMKNTSDYGVAFPTGMYVFDFSGYGGVMSGYAGSRDFIDTERLSEFWVRFSTSEGCKVTTIQENISRLR